MANRDTAKTWFETGDFPTQTQFWQLFDWLLFKDETVAQSNVDGLIAALAAKADLATVNQLVASMGREAFLSTTDLVYTLNANYRLQTVILIPTVDCDIKIGTTNGGEDIMMETQLLANEVFIQDCAYYAVSNASIYINGITASTQVFIYKR